MKKVKKNKVVEFFKPTKKKIILAIIIFLILLTFFPIINIISQVNNFRESPIDDSKYIVIDRFSLIDILITEKVNYDKLNLSIFTILYFILAYLISCFLIIKKEFFKPTILKIALLSISTLSFFVMYTSNDMKLFYPPSIIALIFLMALSKIYSLNILGFSIDLNLSLHAEVFISLMVWYLLACSLVWLYKKFEFFKISKRVVTLDLIISLLITVSYLGYSVTVLRPINESLLIESFLKGGLLGFITLFFIVYLISCLINYFHKKKR